MVLVKSNGFRTGLTEHRLELTLDLSWVQGVLYSGICGCGWEALSEQEKAPVEFEFGAHLVKAQEKVKHKWTKTKGGYYDHDIKCLCGWEAKGHYNHTNAVTAWQGHRNTAMKQAEKAYRIAADKNNVFGMEIQASEPIIGVPADNNSANIVITQPVGSFATGASITISGLGTYTIS